MSDGSAASKGIIKNPLTVIAVFAGLAEVCATIALPQIDISIQYIFVWFVMLFPTLLVCLFFFLLWFKHHVLYAPSDFSDETNFMKYWVPAYKSKDSYNQNTNSQESIQSDEIAIAESNETTNYTPEDSLGSSNSEHNATFRKSEKTIQSYMRQYETGLAENLIVKRLSRQLGLNFIREVALAGLPDVRYDAVAISSTGPVMIEVKRVSSISAAKSIARRELERAALVSLRVPKDTLLGGKLIIAIVSTTTIDDREISELKATYENMAKETNLPFHVELQFFYFEDLKREERAWS